jgi:hypothetical protein
MVLERSKEVLEGKLLEFHRFAVASREYGVVGHQNRVLPVPRVDCSGRREVRKSPLWTTSPIDAHSIPTFPRWRFVNRSKLQQGR